jgi:hypothetical protein
MDTLDAPMSPDEKDPLHSSRKRWMLWSGAAFGVLLVALVVLIALLPTLLSGAWGRSLVVNAITPSVQGSVSLKDLSLSWGGPQQVRGLEIAGSNGDRVTADVEVAGGLWSLVKLSAPLQARLSCAVRSGTAEDGSLTILQMLRGSSSSAAHNATNAQAMPPAASTSTSANPLQALRGSVLEIVRVDVEVTGSGDRPTVAIENLRGTCTLLADGCSLDLAAATKVGERTGNLLVKGSASKCLSPTGEVMIDTMALDIDVQASALAVPAKGFPLVIDRLQWKVASRALSDEARVQGEVAVALPSGEQAVSTIDLTARKPFDATARSFAGSARIERLPSSALAPYLPAPIDAERDIGASLSAVLALDGTQGTLQLQAEHVQISAAASLANNGTQLIVSPTSVQAALQPALIPSLGLTEPLAVKVNIASAALPLPSAGAFDWNACKIEARIATDPTAIRCTDAIVLPLGAATVDLRAPGAAAPLELRIDGTVGGAACSAVQSVDGWTRALAGEMDALHAKGSFTLAPLDIAKASWLPDDLRTTLAQSAVTSVSAAVEQDGSTKSGRALLRLNLGDAAISTRTVWDADALSTEPVDCTLTVAPSLVARFAPESIGLAETARVEVRIDALRIPWQQMKAGQYLPPRVAASIRVPMLSVARAPMLVAPAVMRDVDVKGSFVPAAGARGAGVSAVFTTRVLAASAEAAQLRGSVEWPDLSSPNMRASTEVTMASGSVLAGLLDLGSAGALLTGPGSVRASLDRGAADQFDFDIALPRLKLKGAGSAALDPTGASAARVDLKPTEGSFDLPAEVAEQWLGLRSGVDWQQQLATAAGGRSIRGAFSVESCVWTGSLDSASAVATVKIAPGSIEAPGRERVQFEEVTLSVKSPRVAERAQASLSGTFRVGNGAAGTLSLAVDARGDLRALSSGSASVLALKDSSLGIKVPGSLASEVLRWSGAKSTTANAAALSIGDINLACNIRSLALPLSAATNGSVDLRIDLAPCPIQLPDRPRLGIGALEVVVRSTGLNRELNAAIKGTLAVGDAAPAPLTAAAALSGDMRGLLGAAEVPVTLADSEVSVQMPGALALAVIDLVNGDGSASAALRRVGPVDARARIQSLTLPTGSIAGSAFIGELTLAPIEVVPADGSAVALGSTSVKARTERLGDALDLEIGSDGSGVGSVRGTVAGRQLSTPSGTLSPADAAWNAQIQMKAMPTALIDAAAGQRGELAELLGPSLDGSIDAVSAGSGTSRSTRIRATAKSQSFDLKAPQVDVTQGRCIVSPAAPLEASLIINDVLRRKILRPVTPILADIVSAPPIRFTLTNLSAPLDGDLATLDLDGRIDIGDVQLQRQNDAIAMLAVAQQPGVTTIPAQIDPLLLTVRKGRLTYANFIIRVAKVGPQWQQVLKLSGDINLARTPAFANAITVRYPIASIGRTGTGAVSSQLPEVTEINRLIAQLPVDPGELLDVDVTFSGPLGKVDGKDVPLNRTTKLVFDPSALDSKKIQKGIDNLPQTIDSFKKLFGG